MIKTNIPLLDAGYIGGLTKAYLSNDSDLKAFYNHNFLIENFEKAIGNRKEFDVNRTVLFEVLYQQHVSFFNHFPSLESTIELIKDNNTFTITTGHQICLATGPLYFIYKIASAINLCRKLKIKYPQYNFVPVYWMATEDHDFEEINHIHLFNKTISWNKDTQGATGRISTNDIQPFLNEIKELLGEKIHEVTYFETVLNAYQNHSNLADATRALVLNLFVDKGLLVIDADHKKLKNGFKEIIKKDILGQISNKEVSNTIQELVSQNLIKEEKIQVKPRPINFFYLKDNLRKRFICEENIYKVLETEIVFTETQLLQEIEDFPERFSPNVIMRPVYQECILPNLVYIGGAGELSYWFELKAVFDAHQVYFPMLALRNSFLWVDQKQVEKLNQFDIPVKEIFKPIEQLLQSVLAKIGVEEITFIAEKQTASDLFESIKSQLILIDQTLAATVEGERQKLIKSIEVLEQKLNKAQKLKYETSINQIKKVKDQLFPHAGLQERYENILWLNMKFGSGVIEQIISMAEPDVKELVIISAN